MTPVLLAVTPQTAFLTFLASLCIAVATIGWHFFTSHASTMKIRRLRNENLLLSVGKRNAINYKKAVAMYNEYAKSNDTEKVKEFSSLLTVRIVEEIQSIRSYGQLRQYMQDYERLVSPVLLQAHQQVIETCKLHVGELFNTELLSIKSMSGGVHAQLRAVTLFIQELSSPCFIHFPYQTGNKKAAEKFQKELEVLLEEKGETPVRSISEGQKSSQEKTAN